MISVDKVRASMIRIQKKEEVEKNLLLKLDNSMSRKKVNIVTKSFVPGVKTGLPWKKGHIQLALFV